MDDQKELLARGRELYEARDHFNAEPVLAQLEQAGTTFADVYDMLGVIAHQRGDLAMAEARFRKAVELNPGYTDALLNLAVTLNELRKYDEARQIFERLGKKTSTNDAVIETFARGKIANMHAELAQAYADLGHLNEAIEQMEKAVRLCPSFSDLRVKLAMFYRDAGRHEYARLELQAAVDASPRFVRAHILLGATQLALGDKSSARQSWEEALSIEPESVRAASYLKMLDESSK
ncbi:MAG: tetratricopeptide repeat protein [Polyangiaceae bacterium]|nr:tetratricopeptide repeat protein [Polyangiaceae bacterium]